MKLTSQGFGTMTFPSDYDVIAHCTLNKADLTANNNKYYVIEAHVSKDGKQFRLYSRYGRVGGRGVEEERVPPQNKDSLLASYETLKKEKTSKRKGYREVEVAVTAVGSDGTKGKLLSDDVKNIKVMDDDDTKKTKKKSKIRIPDHFTEKLVTRLYTDAGEAVKKSLSASAQSSAQNPLGVLTMKQINDGREILQDLQQILSNDPSLIGKIDSSVIQRTNDFYSVIPQRLPLKMDDRVTALILNTSDRIDEKEEMLKLLEDAEVMKQGFETNDIDEKYAELGCEFTLVDGTEEQGIIDLVEGSQSSHHRSQGTIKVNRVWKVTIKNQRKKHTPIIEKIGNVEMLFHGSRDCNIAGICKRGLLMRPPGVYITGSMFGNGLYFANQSSKSAQYAWGRFGGGGARRNDTHFLFVAAVALGKIKKYENAQSHLTKPPSGYHSVQGAKGRSLLHDEFIVYDIKQNILEYLVEFEQ